MSAALVLEGRLGRAAELGRVHELVAVERELELLIAQAVVECRAAGVEAGELARALGMSRASLYRRYPVIRGGRADAPGLPLASELYREAAVRPGAE